MKFGGTDPRYLVNFPSKVRHDLGWAVKYEGGTIKRFLLKPNKKAIKRDMTPAPRPQRPQFSEGSIELPPGFVEPTTNIPIPVTTEINHNKSITRDRLLNGDA